MFEEIFERSPVAMILVNENSEIVLVNNHAEELFEYTKDELIGHDIAMLIPFEIRNHHPSLVKEYFKSPIPRQMGVGRNLFGVTKNQIKFPVEVGLNPIETDGKLFVMSSVIDISERVRAEERFKAAVDAAPNGMLMINSTGTIILSNKKTEEIFGYQNDELLQKPIELLVPEDFRIPHPAFVKSYINNPEPRAMGIGRELFGRHKTGKLVPVEIGLQPITFDDEIFVISSIVDITERKEYEKQVQNKNDEIREFSYRTSHDLKSPLLTIGGIIDFIIEDANTGDVDSISSGAHKVKNIVTKLNKLVDDILALTKADMENENKASFNFEMHLNDAKEKFSHILQEFKVEMEGSFLHRKELSVQNTRLSQVLDNLISNAIKYSDKNKNSRYVRINTFNDTENFYIRVEDNGLGIPSNKQDNVFGIFKRFHDTDVEGSGLGLYMIKKHIEKMDAKIDFESSPEGTVFYIQFPLEVDQ